MPDRRQEASCVESYARWLEATKRYQRARPDRCLSDPPDFYIRTNEGDIAVEVTRIQHEEDTSCSASQRALVEELQRATQRRGTLRGTYVVDFVSALKWCRSRHGPTAEPMRSLLDYIARTANARSAAPETVPSHGDPICRISKLSGEDAAVELGDSGHDLGGFVDDVKRELRPLLLRALESKRKWAERSPVPTVLLLHDHYHLADNTTWLSVMPSGSLCGAFGEICVVRTTGDVFVLASHAGTPTVEKLP